MKKLDDFDFGKRKRSKKAMQGQMTHTISPESLQKGCDEYDKRERRAYVYDTTMFLVKHFWGNPKKVAEGLGVLLLVWNNAFYRNRAFDCNALEKYIAHNQSLLDEYKDRNILTYTSEDDAQIKQLFEQLRAAIQICDGKRKGKTSPVGVAKALHLLAPSFFPLWDQKIAKACDCYYKNDAAGQYIRFIKCMKKHCQELEPFVKVGEGATLLKRIDEYLYSEQQKWI
jgi:hypothetical protein